MTLSLACETGAHDETIDGIMTAIDRVQLTACRSGGRAEIVPCFSVLKLEVLDLHDGNAVGENIAGGIVDVRDG